MLDLRPAQGFLGLDLLGRALPVLVVLSVRPALLLPDFMSASMDLVSAIIRHEAAPRDTAAHQPPQRLS